MTPQPLNAVVRVKAISQRSEQVLTATNCSTRPRKTEKTERMEPEKAQAIESHRTNEIKIK